MLGLGRKDVSEKVRGGRSCCSVPRKSSHPAPAVLRDGGEALVLMIRIGFL